MDRSAGSDIGRGGARSRGFLLERLNEQARGAGADLPIHLNTPYVNTIRPEDGSAVSGRPRHGAPHQEPDPLERHGHGGATRTSTTPASAATSPPTRRSPRCSKSASTISFTPAMATSPAISSISRATPRPASTRAPSSKAASPKQHLRNFRHELRDTPGLSSYPHPWLMPDFWQLPHRLHGPRPHQFHLPGALHALPRKPRPHPGHPAQDLGVPGRWRDGRARIDGLAHRWAPAKSSTT